MVVAKSGTLLSWVYMRSEIGKLPLYASDEKPLLTIDLTTGEIQTRGVAASKRRSGPVKKTLSGISAAVAANPIADRLMSFTRTRRPSATEYHNAIVCTSYINISTNNGIIALGEPIDDLHDGVMIEVDYNGNVVNAHADSIVPSISNTYRDIIWHGVSQGEPTVVLEEADLI